MSAPSTAANWPAARPRGTSSSPKAAPDSAKPSAVANAIRPGEPWLPGSEGVTNSNWSMPKSAAVTYSAKVKPPNAAAAQASATCRARHFHEDRVSAASASDVPTSRKPSAALGFMVTQPGHTPVIVGLSVAHPNMTTEPSANAAQPKTPEARSSRTAMVGSMSLVATGHCRQVARWDRAQGPRRQRSPHGARLKVPAGDDIIAQSPRGPARPGPSRPVRPIRQVPVRARAAKPGPPRRCGFRRPASRTHVRGASSRWPGCCPVCRRYRGWSCPWPPSTAPRFRAA